MSITDGTFICGLCGESRTGCNLCGEAPLVDMRESLRREAAAELAAEIELRNQEIAISRSAPASGGVRKD